MTDNTQSEALDLADWLDGCGGLTSKSAAAELRRQHARIADLEAIGAGGVNGPLMTPTPTSGAADLPEALRVPLDSLHADAGYLCGRLLNGSLTQEQVVESIRRRIDAAKLAALTAQAISKAPDHVAEVGNMVEQAISAEPAGAGYAELPDAKTLGEAVAAWIGVETRGAHKRVDTTVDRLGFAVRSVVGDMLRASNGQAPAGVLHLVQDAFAEIAMAFPKAFALHKVGIADTAVREALAAPAAPQADSVLEDAALWHWLAEYLVGTRTDLDDEIVASETVNDLRKLVESAIKQGEKQ